LNPDGLSQQKPADCDKRQLFLPIALPHLESNRGQVVASRIILPDACFHIGGAKTSEVFDEHSGKTGVVGSSFSPVSRGKFQTEVVVLDEFVAATGDARKYAISLLTQPTDPPNKLRRRRTPRYGTAVPEALSVAWAAANHICGQRLVPFLTELVPILERHGHLVLTDQARQELLTVFCDRCVRRIQVEESAPPGQDLF
jgi:hypothetical protein